MKIFSNKCIKHPFFKTVLKHSVQNDWRRPYISLFIDILARYVLTGSGCDHKKMRIWFQIKQLKKNGDA